MGLFEEIERAWFTVDNKLFLWDYTDGREFSRYDQQADTIQAVGLVRARKDVFVDDITHLLVVCTASRASLLGLCRSEKGELSLYATNLATETATAMIDIKGTDAGRIFLLGANKDLYELEYSTTGGWLSGGSKMWITNRSSSYLSTWVPSILTSGSNEGIESFVVDPKQGRLFVLRSRGEIEYYSITGSNFESRGKYASLHADFQRLRYGGATPAQGSRVVSIAIVGAHESTKAWLVAISASGARIYLGQSLYGGVSLQMVGHRAPLPETTRVAPQSFYSSGTTVAVQVSNDSEPSTRVTITSPWAGRQSAMRENFESYQPPVLQEWSVVETIPSQVWTIAEVHETNPANAPTTLRRSDNIALSALPRQATVGARKLLLLATSGIFWVTLPRPIDMLEADIDLEKEAAVTAARNAFGRVQLASMAVLLGTRAVSGSENKSPDLASAAMSILLAAEAPIIRTSQTGVRTIVYSPRHDGLALILARLLRPVWNAKVAVPAGAKKLGLGVPVKTLQSVQARLAELRRYLDEHPFPRHQAEGDAKTAWDQEELSLHGLQTLLKQAIEAISFVLLLNDYKLADVIAKTDAETQSTLQSLTFQALLTSPNGREVARKLVTALIELQIGADLGIDNLSAILQQRCGSFVQSGDVVLYKAEEGLRRAEGTRDAHERAEQLAESLRLFERAAESAPAAVFPRLHDATRRYRALRDVRATIELPLRVATELDRDDKAGDYVRDGRQPGDPRAAFLEQRQECYQLVVQALGSYDDELNKPGAGVQASRLRDEAYALAIASDDELFHFYLYDWIVALGRSDNLLEVRNINDWTPADDAQFDTPFIETYLQLTASNVPDRRDLLWKYYARREDYLPAAKALADLALREGNISLSERVYYLAQALTNTKSAASVGAEDVEFMTTLQERIDIAQVQLEIVRAVEAHPDMSDADKAEPLQQLEAELLTLDDMYQRFARPLRLFESILLILKTADLRLEDVCTAVWMQLIRTRAAQVPIDASVGELVTDLCRKFYPSEGAPADLILPLVYGEAAPYEESTAPGWATEALHAGGVGLRDLWDAVTMMHDEMAPETREYFAEEAAALLAIWLKHPSLDLPPADVDQFATAYILRTQGATLDARRSETRKMMNAAKAAAAKF
jgi:nuclear pore complex protein Nup155